jgi:DNA-3-methyladenine glycosylase I
MNRCPWPGTDPLMFDYHDREWGLPARDDARLFEMLLLEGAQAGLSWITILRKRENYRRAFDGFDAERIAEYDDAKVAALLADPGIVRNRLKVAAFVKNAQAFLKVRDEHGSFADYIWQFTGGQSIVNRFTSMAEIPAASPEAEAMSKDLKRRGFTFVGPTICYAFMQACGMVNDHLVTCHRHSEVQAAR